MQVTALILRILDSVRAGKYETVPTSDQLVDHSIDSLLIGKDNQSLSIVGKDMNVVEVCSALSK